MFNIKHIITFLSLGYTSAACGPGEIFVVGQTFLAGSKDPTQGSTPWSLTSHGVAEKLFTVDEKGEIVGQIGELVTKVSENLWEVKIKQGYKFSDGTPVDAKHVADSLMEQNKKNGSAQSSLGNIIAQVTGDLTLTIQTERPTHIMDSVLAEWPFIIYTRDDDNDLIFTGPYVISHFSVNDHMDLVPNQYYPQADERPPIIELKKFSDGHDLAEAVKSKKVDIGFHLPIDTLSELRGVDGVDIRSFEVGYHYMAFYNTDSLSDVRVRNAIDLAIDRTELSQALAGGKPTRSLFPDNSPFYTDDSDPHDDEEASKALLDEAGWVLNGRGKRTKDGEELKVRLVAYPHRPGLVIMQPIIAKVLQNLGIAVETILTGDDWSETQAIIDDRTFDMLMWAQHTLPAGDPAWFLNSFFRSNGENNHANLISTTVDEMLDNLSNAENHNDRIFLTEVAQRGIQQEVPISNLVTPLWHVGLNKDCAADYEPYGSDYYVIRSDLRVKTDASEGFRIVASIPFLFIATLVISLW